MRTGWRRHGPQTQHPCVCRTDAPACAGPQGPLPGRAAPGSWHSGQVACGGRSADAGLAYSGPWVNTGRHGLGAGPAPQAPPWVLGRGTGWAGARRDGPLAFGAHAASAADPCGSLTEPSDPPAGPPRMADKVVPRQVARLGRTVRLQCPVEGDPPPLTMWTKDGRTIHGGWSRFRVLPQGLRVKEVERGDAGAYVCKATNGFGSLSVNYTLIVTGQCHRAGRVRGQPSPGHGTPPPGGPGPLHPACARPLSPPLHPGQGPDLGHHPQPGPFLSGLYARAPSCPKALLTAARASWRGSRGGRGGRRVVVPVRRAGLACGLGIGGDFEAQVSEFRGTAGSKGPCVLSCLWGPGLGTGWCPQ